MALMPNLISEYRQGIINRRQSAKDELELESERKRLYTAASKKLTDMRDLVDDYDGVDDLWYDSVDNYYRKAYVSKDNTIKEEKEKSEFNENSDSESFDTKIPNMTQSVEKIRQKTSAYNSKT